MKINLKEISIRDLVEGYQDLNEDGVFGYGGKLDIRPPFQREFIYKDKQREAVIDTIIKNYPLNLMYWSVRKDGGFEVIDGQQRTISICQYIVGDFSFNARYFHNLQIDERNKILDFKLMVYLCDGTDSEKLEWFKTINIIGLKLNDQELRNAVYSGAYVSDAKRYFSKNNCVAYNLASDYLNGSANRQEYLETAIKWISNDNIENYMGQKQNETYALELWNYFQSVFIWVKGLFKVYRREMKGRDWGFLYNEYKEFMQDPNLLEERISTLMIDDDIDNKKGIYEYVLSGNEKFLNIRKFSPNQIREAFEKQKGICVKCQNQFELKEMEADHITPWSKGGKTNAENCQMLCLNCNRIKSDK